MTWPSGRTRRGWDIRSADGTATSSSSRPPDSTTGWLDNAGHPNTGKLRVTERFRRRTRYMDIGVIDDPGAAKPWTVTLPLLFQDTDLLGI
jgi:hypothetical protein